MFRAYGTAPPEAATAGDLYTWNSPFYNKGRNDGFIVEGMVTGRLKTRPYFLQLLTLALMHEPFAIPTPFSHTHFQPFVSS
jgi:hypothetical protein